jgi:ERCC4-type nuclease
MVLLIDSREPKHLVDAIMAEIPDARVETLVYGDFIIEGSNQRIVIERKQVSDLFNSLQDGRLWDQMKGIEKFDGYKKVLLIEGSLWQAQKWNPKITLARYTGVKVSLLYGWEGITLTETQNQSETVDFLKRLVVKVGSGQEETYTRGLGFTKIERTPNEELVDVLRGIDGIAEMRARELLVKFKTLSRLSKATMEELTNVLGEKIAKHVYDVVRRKYTDKKLEKEAEDETSG